MPKDLHPARPGLGTPEQRQEAEKQHQTIREQKEQEQPEKMPERTRRP